MYIYRYGMYRWYGFSYVSMYTIGQLMKKNAI